MKTIIAGSRDIGDYRLVCAAVSAFGEDVTEVVSGACRGVDKLGETWAAARSIPVKRFPADWDKFGKSAGPIRNRQMAAYAEALVALWDGKSKGTKNMIEEAEKRGLKIHIHRV